MSTPGGIAVYTESGPPPMTVADRPWRGVYHHWSGHPDALGAELIARVKRAKGDLQQVVRAVIDRARGGWSSLADNEPLEDAQPLRPNDGMTCYAYVFDVPARRLDCFATHSEAEGELMGSVTFDAGGNALPGEFQVREPEPKWFRAPIDTGWPASDLRESAQRFDVLRRLERDCAEVGLQLEGFLGLMVHGLSDLIYRASWPGEGPLSRIHLRPRYGQQKAWSVHLGALELRYPPPDNRSGGIAEPHAAGERLALFDSHDRFVTIDVSKAEVTLALGENRQKVLNVLVSALPSEDWVPALLDQLRARTVPGAWEKMPEPPPQKDFWRTFTHPDGRHWAIRETKTGYVLRLGAPTDDPVLKERKTLTPIGDVERLISEQLADGFTQVGEEPR